MAPKLLLKIRKEYYTKMVQDLSDPQMRWTITCMVDGLTGQYVSDVSFSCPNSDCHYRTVLQNFYTGVTRIGVSGLALQTYSVPGTHTGAGTEAQNDIYYSYCRPT